MVEEVCVGEAGLEENVAAVGHEGEARVEACALCERGEQKVYVARRALPALQSVGGRLVVLQLGAVVIGETQCVVAQVLDLRATEIIEARELLFVGRRPGDE